MTEWGIYLGNTFEKTRFISKTLIFIEEKFFSFPRKKLLILISVYR